MRFLRQTALGILLLALSLNWIAAGVFAEEMPAGLPENETEDAVSPEKSLPEEETESGFQLVFSGEIAPGSTLEFGTEPELENVIYAVRTDPEGNWLVLETNRYTIPSGSPGSYVFWVAALWKDISAENLLELTYTIEPPADDSTPEETKPEETKPEETKPEETKPEETKPQETEPEETVSGPGLYFGQLHAHTALSGGSGSAAEAFRYAANVPGLDFFAVTDHSHTFDNPEQASISQDAAAISTLWKEGKAAAEAVTDEDFVGIFGYEMSWHAQEKLGHITTFHTPGFQTRDQDDYRQTVSALENYYGALASQPDSVSQFSHPGNRYGTFSDFAYSAKADEVISLLEVGSGGDIAFDAYTRALDRGWHVAPTNNQANYDGNWGDASDDRTVIYAQSLTEADLCAAMGDCRVYATQDRDLEILYSLDGFFMGSRVPLRQLGDTADLSVTLRDPTDREIGLVEVITSSGESAAAAEVETGYDTVTFSLSPEQPYYYLRITQPDGDVAVTAPVWIEQQELLGIRELTSETEVPLQNQPVTLALSLYNQETADLLVEKIQVLSGEEVILEDASLKSVESGQALIHKITVSFDFVGQTPVTVRLLGTLEGADRTYEKETTLFFRRSQEVSEVLLDGSHGNSGLSELSDLEKMVSGRGIALRTLTEPATPEDLQKARLLIITAPQIPFGDDFLNTIEEFAAYGGSIVVCGRAGDSEGNARLNELLAAVGSSARIGDTISNGAFPVLLSDINTASEWCACVQSGQKYRMVTGCAVDPGQGQWLVRGKSAVSRTEEDGTVVLACEQGSGGGTVFVAGSLFLRGDCIRETGNIWELPAANRTIAKAIMGLAGEPPALSTIAQARKESAGQLLRIRGYAASGTDNPYNTFPDTLYLQDDTGGIALMPFKVPGIEPGTALEITGYPEQMQGNRVFNPVSWEVLDAALYHYPAKTGSWANLMNAETHGGEFVQLEGTCEDVQLRTDGTLASFSLKKDGHTALVVIDDGIFAGSDGSNDLHEVVLAGRTIRAKGFVHRDASGKTVLRVRNCEEVDYVPPLTEIPKTGDAGIFACVPMALSLAGLLMLGFRKKE